MKQYVLAAFLLVLGAVFLGAEDAPDGGADRGDVSPLVPPGKTAKKESPDMEQPDADTASTDEKRQDSGKKKKKKETDEIKQDRRKQRMKERSKERRRERRKHRRKEKTKNR